MLGFLLKLCNNHMKPGVQALQKAEHCEAKHNTGRPGKVVFNLNLLL